MEALQAGLEKQISEMEFEKSKYVERISNLQDQAKKSSSQTLSLLSGTIFLNNNSHSLKKL